LSSGTNGDDSVGKAGETHGHGTIGHDQRLGRLDAQLDRLQRAEQVRTAASRQTADASERMGNRVLADLIGGIAGGALLGWLADRLLNTAPWGLLTLLALGVIVAFRNIFRLTNGGRTSGVIPENGTGDVAGSDVNDGVD
jgi:ATP synthase protein I